MRVIYLLIFSCVMGSTSYASPFYDEEELIEFSDQTTTNQESIRHNHSVEPAEKQKKLTACNLPDNVNIRQIKDDFESLSLVGVAKINHIPQALFINMKDRLIGFKVGDYIENAFIQIVDINLKQITYIDWANTQDCQSPDTVTIKL
ncbi:hypothetical protein EV693_102283 [Nicoletella semolina]|uniref:Pilus assembly protein PilP n=1 Tax=Nicoletella semolina TaxID=271160 RepID=A0A4R2NBU2_9PAST|nr:pilus assembly protein PilP [Nicoletella semolina]MDH2925053.1 hypothetical protein [Nicoletella semolina]TCP18603.1 hypothetical protein EV693_102283 [Nicoletella semolina]